MPIELVDEWEIDPLLQRIDKSKRAVGIVPITNEHVYMVRRVHPPFPGRYSIITGNIQSRQKLSTVFEELYEELYSSPLRCGQRLSKLSECHNPLLKFEVDDATTGCRIFVYECRLQDNDFIPYEEEVDSVKPLFELKLDELNPLTQFIVWQRMRAVLPVIDPSYLISVSSWDVARIIPDDIRYAHTKRGFLIDYNP